MRWEGNVVLKVPRRTLQLWKSLNSYGHSPDGLCLSCLPGMRKNRPVWWSLVGYINTGHVSYIVLWVFYKVGSLRENWQSLFPITISLNHTWTCNYLNKSIQLKTKRADFENSLFPLFLYDVFSLWNVLRGPGLIIITFCQGDWNSV